MCEIQNKIVKFFNFSEKSFCVIGTADDINLSDLLRLGFSKYYLSDEQRVCWMCFGVRTKFSILWTIFMARSLLDMDVCVLLPITRQAFVYVQMNLQLMVFMLPVTRRPLLKKAILCNSVPNFSNWSSKAEILVKALYLAMKYPYDIINGKWTTADDAF